MATTRVRDPFRTVTPALKWREALEDLIDAAADEGVIVETDEPYCGSSASIMVTDEAGNTEFVEEVPQ